MQEDNVSQANIRGHLSVLLLSLIYVWSCGVNSEEFRIPFLKISAYQMGKSSHQFFCRIVHFSLSDLQALVCNQKAWFPPGHFHGPSR